MEDRFVTVLIFSRKTESSCRAKCIYKVHFATTLTLTECLSYFIDNTKEYAAALRGGTHCYRIVVRDFDSRLSANFRV